MLASIHHAIDAITRAGTEDKNAVRAAADDERLYLPTRLIPEDCDFPHPYIPAPASRAKDLLTSYNTAISASTRPATTLDSAAAALGSPSWPLAALRTSQHATFDRPVTGSMVQAAQPNSQRSPVAEPEHKPMIGRS